MAAVLAIPTFTSVQWLMDHARGQGMVVSCYADLAVSGGVRSLWRERLDVAVQQVAGTLKDDDDARRELERNAAVIRETLASPAAKRAHGAAVFSGVQSGLLRAFLVGMPFVDRLVVDEEPYIVPLLELLHRQRRFLVVHTDTHHGRVYSTGRGSTRLLMEIAESVPRKHGASGELWGKQQATIARHREDHLLRYRKELVREIERAWPDEPYAGIVLMGEHVVLEHLRKELPASLAAHVMAEGPYPFVGSRARLEVRVAQLVDDAAREHDRRLADDIKMRIVEGRGVATGPQGVIDAIRNSQVNWPGSVVLEPDRGEPAWRCTGCDSIFAAPTEPCPYCGARCRKANLWQEIALLAERHAITVHFVGPDVGLAKVGGAAAILTRDHPWEPLAGGAPGRDQRLAG